MQKFTRLFILGLLILIIAGCSGSNDNSSAGAEDTGNGESAEESVTLNFVFPNTHAADPYQEIFDKFTEETGHKVELQPLPGDNYGNMIKTRFGTGDYPDIFLMDPGTKQNAKFKAEEELYEWSGEEEVLSRLADSTREAQTAADGKVYGIPWGDTGAMGVYYNKQVFEEAGVEPPENYEDFLSIAEKIKAAGKTPIYEAMSDAWPAQVFHLTGWTSHVDPAIGEEGVAKLDKNELRLKDIPELKDLFERQLDIKERGLYQDNLMAGTYEDQQEQFGQGNVGMIFQIANFLPSMVDKFGEEFVRENVGFFPFPADDGKGVAMISQPYQLMVSKKGEHAEVAAELVRFMVQEEVVDSWYASQPGIPIFKDAESELLPAQEEVVAYMEAGNAKVNIQNRLSATFVSFDKALQNMFMTDDAEEALVEMDKNYVKDGESKRLPGFTE